MKLPLDEFHPSLLIPYVKSQYPAKGWLVAAMEDCDAPVKREPAYLYYVLPDLPNQMESLWQHKECLTVQTKEFGELCIDVLDGDRVGGVEFLKYITY